MDGPGRKSTTIIYHFGRDKNLVEGALENPSKSVVTGGEGLADNARARRKTDSNKYLIRPAAFAYEFASLARVCVRVYWVEVTSFTLVRTSDISQSRVIYIYIYVCYVFTNTLIITLAICYTHTHTHTSERKHTQRTQTRYLSAPVWLFFII